MDVPPAQRCSGLHPARQARFCRAMYRPGTLIGAPPALRMRREAHAAGLPYICDGEFLKTVITATKKRP